jgi:hypothetical protein
MGVLQRGLHTKKGQRVEHAVATSPTSSGRVNW